MTAGSLLGLDIGGTKTAVVVGDRSGAVLERREIASGAARGFDAMFGDLAREVDAALARAPSVDAIGVSIGGPLDADAGLVLGPPHLPGWDRVPLAALLRERTGRPVYLEHDAKAGALAEWMFGAARGTRSAVFLTCGTGLGAGVIADGRLLRGAADAAGEVGHWRVAADGPSVYGKRGSWEGYASGTGLAALARERFPSRFAGADAVEIARLARAGDADAAAVIDESGRHLGRGLALLVDLLAPEVIVIGTLARHLGEAWLAPARAELAAEALPALAARCRVVPSALGESIGDVAALCAAIHHEERA